MLTFFLKAKTGESSQKDWSGFDQFVIDISCSATYFLEVRAPVSLKVATKGSLRAKKLWKFRFLGYFSNAKPEECDQKVWNIFDQFGISITFSATYFLEVVARVSLKVATKGSFRGKKLWRFRFLGSVSKAKTEECDQKVLFFFDKLSMLMFCFNTYFLEFSAHVSLKVTTKDHFRRKKVQKFSIVIAFLSSKHVGVWPKTLKCFW